MKSNQKDAWSLVREATMFLREKERELASWRQKKWRRIKEEEKEDRLSVSKMTKKRFWIKKLSKEESLRFRTRKEERQEVAEARTNLWRHYREQGDTKTRDMEKEEIKAWDNLREGVMLLAEKSWRLDRARRAHL